MTSDVRLLPLPEKVEVDKHLPTGVRIYAYDKNTLKDYARANVEHHTAAKDAEIEALREQADKFKLQVRDTCVRAEKAEARAERLAEALRPLAELDLTPDDFGQRPDSQPIYARNKTAITVGDIRKACAALEQEANDGRD